MRQAFCALLGQAGTNPDAANIPGLPPAPWVELTLFESPWTAVVVLVALGGVLFWWFNRAQQARTGAVALGASLVAAVALGLTSHFVTTERERLIARTEALVAAVAKADTTALSSMLAPDVRVTVFERDRGFTADSIPRWVDDHMRPGTGNFAIREHSVGSATATIDAPNAARTQVHVRVTPEFLGITTGSWWRLHWRRDGAEGTGSWRVTQIEAMQIDAVPQGTDVNAQGPG